ncbi:MAG: ABC transporter ATP-binding protein [Clostridium sp.]
MNSFLEVKDLSFSYMDNRILEGISLDFEKGKFYSIIGPNGCGKTTLIKNIARLISPKKNTIYIDGKSICKLSSNEVAKIISHVPQNLHINYEFKVFDIVMMARVPHKKRFEMYNSKDEEIVIKAMNDTHTLKFKDKLITELSGGELQRVIAARALAQETDIILLDEPTSHLDLQFQIEFLRVFKEICKDKIIIAVLHDLNLVSLFSNEIIMLKNGRVYKVGESREVITEANIRDVYNINVKIIEDSGEKYVLPII